MQLKAEQRRFYQLLPAEARCFVRVCDGDAALWVSDLPRRMSDCDQSLPVLKEAGFLVTADATNGLWYIDWTMERWQAYLSSLPEWWPTLPENDQYHEAYALCRFWLLHPAPLSEQNLPMARRVVKLTAQPAAKMLSAVRLLHQKEAEQLRQGQPVAYPSGRILVNWLYEQACGKENQS